jgi:CheY-like chemotaxis protein
MCRLTRSTRGLTQRRAVVRVEWLGGLELPTHAVVLEANYVHQALEAGWDRVDTLRRSDPQPAAALMRWLREYAAPILVLSARFGRGLAGSAEAARRRGVKKVLPKSFTRKELLAAVRESVGA